MKYVLDFEKEIDHMLHLHRLLPSTIHQFSTHPEGKEKGSW